MGYHHFLHRRTLCFLSPPVIFAEMRPDCLSALPTPSEAHTDLHWVREEENSGSEGAKTRTLTGVNMGRRNQKEHQWPQDNFCFRAGAGRSSMTSGELLLASSICHLILPLLHLSTSTNIEPTSKLCCSKSGRCWLSKGRMY